MIAYQVVESCMKCLVFDYCLCVCVGGGVGGCEICVTPLTDYIFLIIIFFCFMIDRKFSIFHACHE